MYGAFDIERKNTDSPPSGPKSNKQSSYFQYAVVIPLLLAFVGVFYAYTHSGIRGIHDGQIFYTDELFSDVGPSKFDVPESIHLKLSSSFVNDIQIIAENEYGIFNAPYPYLVRSPNSVLIEPYRNTTLTVTGMYTESNEYYFKWVISGDKSFEMVYDGPKITVLLEITGIYDMSLHVYNSEGYLTTFASKIYCKYVKREIRKLTGSDREKLLDAMHAIWEYSTKGI
jgi:hypothetical protein